MSRAFIRKTSLLNHLPLNPIHFLASFLASLCIVSSSVFAYECPTFCSVSLNPYIGFDAEVRQINFDQGFGDKVFEKTYPEGNIYLGIKFNECFGIEGGYRATIDRVKTTSVGAGETVVGIAVTNPPQLHRGTLNMKAWYGQLVGFLPVCEPYCVLLYGNVGLTNVNLYARDKLIQDSIQAFFDNTNNRTFRANKVLPTLGGGVQFKIDERCSIRMGLRWENTSQFSNLTSEENALAKLRIRDSFIGSIGMVIDIF